MYVGAASQHVLRMSFVPEQEAHNFDRQVTTFGPTSSNATSPLRCFPHPSNLVDLEWALQFNAMLLPHGALRSRLFPH